MIIKYFAWLKNITEIEEELISDTNIKDINSLKIFLKKKYPKLEIIPFEVKINITEATSNLSAIGSKKVPKLDISFLIRAKYPSK